MRHPGAAGSTGRFQRNHVHTVTSGSIELHRKNVLLRTVIQSAITRFPFLFQTSL
jgi:hypothetical protein